MNKGRKFADLTKLEQEEIIFLIDGSRSAKLYLNANKYKKSLTFDEVSEILKKVWRLGYMELFDDIISRNLKVINEEAEYYENLPDLPFKEFFMKQLDKNMKIKFKNYFESSDA